MKMFALKMPPFDSYRLTGPWLSLVERLNGVQEAAGSNPAGPTIAES